MSPRTAEADQLAIDEREVRDSELEALLERRLRAKDDVSEVRARYKRADDDARAALGRLTTSIPKDGALRIGRFRITLRHRDARSVSFDVEAKDQVTIGLVEAEA